MHFFRLAPLPFFAGYSPGLRCAVESALNAWQQLSADTLRQSVKQLTRRCRHSVVTIYEKAPLLPSGWRGRSRSVTPDQPAILTPRELRLNLDGGGVVPRQGSTRHRP